MMETDDILPLAGKRWRIGTAAARQQSPAFDVTASRAECDALAGALDLLGCTALRLTGEVRPLAGRRFRLIGQLTADVVQACVVSLAPVPAHIEEPIDLELWPEDEMPAQDAELDLEDPEARDPPQPIRDNAVDLGAIAYETLALALDPYPRHPDAALASELPEEQPPSPFAALARLREVKD